MVFGESFLAEVNCCVFGLVWFLETAVAIFLSLSFLGFGAFFLLRSCEVDVATSSNISFYNTFYDRKWVKNGSRVSFDSI